MGLRQKYRRNTALIAYIKLPSARLKIKKKKNSATALVYIAHEIGVRTCMRLSIESEHLDSANDIQGLVF